MRKRRKNYWEPIYETSDLGVFQGHDWDFSHGTGVDKCTFSAQNLPPQFKKVEGITFTQCDFEGVFEERSIIFVRCRFEKCDFGLSTFKKIKFTSCEFSNCSFTQCSLLNSEFRSCKFSNIGLSGNETIIEKTLITNPREFISSATTNTQYLPKGTSKRLQNLRLFETKSTLSRILLDNLSREGSETSYYEAVRTSTVHESLSRIASAQMRFISSWNNNCNLKRGVLIPLNLIVFLFQIVSAYLDLFLLHVLGFVNAWGASLSRPVIIGVLILLAYGYHYSGYRLDNLLPSMKIAAEVALLFGYTNYSDSSLVAFDGVVLFSNAIIGVVWYIVAIPTIVNRLTRVR